MSESKTREAEKVSDTSRFWWMWVVGVLAVIVTPPFVSEWLQYYAFSPQPRLELRESDRIGEYQIMTMDTGKPEERDYTARYYTAHLVNDRRWRIAHNVRVMVRKVEQQRGGGGWITQFSGDGIYAGWSFSKDQPRTLGPDSSVTLFSIIRDFQEKPDATAVHTLELLHAARPRKVPKYTTGPVKYALTLQAVSDEAESAILCVEVDWNGDWHDGDVEMAERARVAPCRG